MHIKDNNNPPQGKFHRFPFSSKFPDLTFVLYIYSYSFNETGTRHKQWAWVTSGKTVYVPHFNRDTVASRERDESTPGIKTLLPFLEKLYGGERFGEFSRSHLGL